MAKQDSLVDEKILSVFGSSDSLDINLLIKEIELLGNHVPPLLCDKPYIKNTKKEFSISKEPRDKDQLYSNFSKFFSDCINWKSPKTQFNITPPVTIPSVAASAVSSLLNPNAIWDVACGGFAELEIKLSSYLSNLVGWTSDSLGIFTFGGTATNMYGIKIGINKCKKDALNKGVDKDIFVISNEEGHSCHVTLCNWLGIGMDNCIRLKTNSKGRVDSDVVLKNVEKLIKENKKIGCIILNGGTNFNGRIDPILEVSKGLNELVEKYRLDYCPHIHVDSVIGWVFLLFKDYDFEKNELSFPENIRKKLKEIYNQIKEIQFADSFGVDFHKSGFCPYLSSIFITKDINDANILNGDNSVFKHQSFNFGEYKPGEYTLETSRPVNGAVTSYITLNALGLSGIRKIIANFLYVADDLREKINDSSFFSNCNADALGWGTLFLAKQGDNSPLIQELYDSSDKGIVEKNNEFQKGFYNFLTKKYNNKLLWNIGFSKCFMKNKFDIPISSLKSYPMSPFNTCLDNDKLIIWLIENLKEYKNE